VVFIAALSRTAADDTAAEPVGALAVAAPVVAD